LGTYFVAWFSVAEEVSGLLSSLAESITTIPLVVSIGIMTEVESGLSECVPEIQSQELNEATLTAITEILMSVVIVKLG